MEKRFIGVDIGGNGGVVVLDSEMKVIEVFKTPESRKDWIAKLNPYKDSFCILEKVHSHPVNGGKANFTFGQTSERTLFALEVAGISYKEVTPQTWMKEFMLKKEKSESGTKWKNRLKAKAESLFPNEKVTLWNADAFLQAWYCWKNFK